MSESATRKETMDGEHRVQFGLIRALQAAVESGEDAALVGRLLQQLIDYSEAHFISEELLMRLADYDDHEGHAESHRDLLESLRTAQRQFQTSGNLDLVAQVAKSSLAFLIRHIQTSDKRFAHWEAAALS